VGNRRDDILDAAISVLGESGIHRLTHRAVDAAAGLPAGSTSNHFRTRDALLNAVMERVAVRERANFEDIAVTLSPTTPPELARAITTYLQDGTGSNRTLTLARYAILLEAAVHPPLRAQLTAGGARVRAWFMNWLRAVGSTDPERDAPIILNYCSGLVLHELANPAPAFDPSTELTALVTAVVHPRSAEVPT
jgi:DNA-binding transcriptional regulator YbjK